MRRRCKHIVAEHARHAASIGQTLGQSLADPAHPAHPARETQASQIDAKSFEASNVDRLIVGLYRYFFVSQIDVKSMAG